MDKKILIVTLNKFPNGDAGSVRLMSFCKILTLLQYSPFIIGGGTPSKSGTFQGIKYSSMYRSNKKYRKIFNYVFQWRTIQKEVNKNKNLRYLMVVDASLLAWIYIKVVCKRKKIILFHDCVEWYSKEQFSLPYINYFYLKKNIINKYIINKSVNVIAISNYLYTYFLNKEIHSIKVPVILDENDFLLKKKSEKLVFTYAGTPGKKDYLNIMLKSFCYLDEVVLSKIELHLYGVTLENVLDICCETEVLKLKKCLECYGRVSREEVLNGLINSTYTILYRDSTLRYAKAGFPTKVVESMMCGVPVITNITSDLNDYLADSVNAILCMEDNIPSFAEAIKKAIGHFESGLYVIMSRNAYTTAINDFAFNKYVVALKEFIEESELV